MSETTAGEEEPGASRPTPLGIYDRTRNAQITSVEVIAGGLTLLWLVATGVFFLAVPADGLDEQTAQLRRILLFLAIFLPVVMIWLAALVARSARQIRDESQRLQTAIDAIRQSYIAQNQGRSIGADVSVARKLDEIAAATRKTETTLATFTSTRHDAARPAGTATAEDGSDQPVLALGTPVEEISPPLAAADFIRAMNFPETAEDEEGFAALRRALSDRSVNQLIQAAQDVLTLLSQDGIYVDDLRPDRARPEIWRHFAEGGRGKSIAPLGGVRDRSSLALTAGRMKQDPIFRDAAHHFLRKYDQIVSIFVTDATDAEISALADTRTSRAFMLLGRVAGTFD